MESHEMKEMDNEGTTDSQEMGATENTRTSENEEMDQKRTTENQEMEECNKMSSTALNTVSSSVSESNAADIRASRILSRQEVIAGSKKEFYFFTVSGVLRLLQIFFSTLHLGSFGYFGTYYDSLKPEITVTPFYLSAVREVFFMLVNFNTLLNTLSIIVASVVSIRSHNSLLGSLFMFVFDFVQFLLVTSSSVSLLLLYSEAESKKVIGRTTQIRQGLSITGMLLGVLHLIGAIYDLGIYIRRLDSRIIIA